MTAFELITQQLRPAGLPWDIAKGFDTSCAVGDFIAHNKILDPQNVELRCKVNDSMKQNSNTNDMIFPVSELISYVSEYVTWQPGDLLLTGTPGGAGAVQRGDVIECEIPGISHITFNVE